MYPALARKGWVNINYVLIKKIPLRDKFPQGYFDIAN
jgi:hypothetical protein